MSAAIGRSLFDIPKIYTYRVMGGAHNTFVCEYRIDICRLLSQ